MARKMDGSACEAFARTWRDDEVAHDSAKDLPCAARLRAQLERERIAAGVFRLTTEAGRPGAYRFAEVGENVPSVLPFARPGARLDGAYTWLERRDADRLLQGILDARAKRTPVRLEGALSLGPIRNGFELVLAPALTDNETLEYWGAVEPRVA
ncbi:MAG: hypothetical protein NBV67_04815 [Tagaea sp.]|nr:hypothetical protein [Tagaea sp.]